MDLNLLKVLAKVSDRQSFTGAAKELGIPKSSVSQKITQLENDLGVRLFERTTRSVKLTDAGDKANQIAKEIIEQSQELLHFADQVKSTPTGTIRLSVPQDIGDYLITNVLPKFFKDYPDISIDLHTSNRYVDLIEENFDLAIRAASKPLKDSNMVSKKIGETRINLYASPRYLTKHPTLKENSDLKSHRILLFSNRTLVMRHCQSPDQEIKIEPNGSLRIHNINAARLALLSHLGIGALPEFSCRNDIIKKRLIQVLPDWSSDMTELYFIFPSRKYLPAKLREFMRYLEPYFQPK